ncbi:MAG: hypothetical protein F6K26_50625 [Moorea sp. SIO2I5]|nr:hypothetical protein [Moorena sp. SIO2I5]
MRWQMVGSLTDALPTLHLFPTGKMPVLRKMPVPRKMPIPQVRPVTPLPIPDNCHEI